MKSALALVQDILDEALQPRRDLTVTGWADARVTIISSPPEMGGDTPVPLRPSFEKYDANE